MSRIHWLVLALSGALSPSWVQACSNGPVRTAFDTVAPTATDIVVIRVEALELEPTSDLMFDHRIRAKIRVLKHYRGAGDFTELTYTNSTCAGLRIDIGGIYLVATSSPAPSISLNSAAAPLLFLRGPSPYDTQAILENSGSIQKLESALRGEGTFEITTTNDWLPMVTELPAPPVPAPEEVLDR